MADKTQQHFVPQFYFRRFSQGKQFIHLLIKSASEIKLQAPVRGQCARRRFYGSNEVEGAIKQSEDTYSAALREASKRVWDGEKISPEHVRILIEACLFQHARTSLQATKIANAFGGFFLNLAKEIAVANGEDPSDGIEIEVSPQWIVLNGIRNALQSVPLMTDLGIRFIRNVSPYPFIFGDAPVVFHNSYMRNVPDRGALGYQSRGLQIFWPLDSNTLFLATDDTVYSGYYRKTQIVDVASAADVSQLNALQLHYSNKTVYFGDSADKDYVLTLWFNHSSGAKIPEVLVQPRPDLTVTPELTDDLLPSGELIQFCERQAPITLALSFMSCVPLRADSAEVHYRSPQLVVISHEHDPP